MIINGIDITEVFRALKKGNRAKAEQSELIQALIQKI